MPGPAPTPTSLLKLRGSPRAKYHRNENEPQPDATMPECPSWLSESAKEVWAEVAPQLRLCGCLTRIDGRHLARYCQLWARWKRLELWLQEKGETYPIFDKDGKPKAAAAWPQAKIAANLSEQLTRMEQGFGMTPASRTRVSTSQNKSETTGKARFFDKTG